MRRTVVGDSCGKQWGRTVGAHSWGKQLGQKVGANNRGKQLGRTVRSNMGTSSCGAQLGQTVAVITLSSWSSTPAVVVESNDTPWQIMYLGVRLTQN